MFLGPGSYNFFLLRYDLKACKKDLGTKIILDRGLIKKLVKYQSLTSFFIRLKIFLEGRSYIV